MNLTLTVSLYDVAGERVTKPVTGPLGSNSAPLDAGGLASGLYLVVVDLTDANGGSAGRRITKIVVMQ
jgi:hypothetical protein